ncbi:hypothetical protein MRX96_022807 [Rhipicephalus microplus]
MSCTCSVHEAPRGTRPFCSMKAAYLISCFLDNERARRHANIYTKREVRSARKEVTPDVPGLITAAAAFKLPETRLNGSPRVLGVPRLWSCSLGSATWSANTDIDLCGSDLACSEGVFHQSTLRGRSRYIGGHYGRRPFPVGSAPTATGTSIGYGYLRLPRIRKPPNFGSHCRLVSGGVLEEVCAEDSVAAAVLCMQASQCS